MQRSDQQDGAAPREQNVMIHMPPGDCDRYKRVERARRHRHRRPAKQERCSLNLDFDRFNLRQVPQAGLAIRNL